MERQLLKNGEIYTESGKVKGDILIIDGRIAALGSDGACTAAEKSCDCAVTDLMGKKAVPGFIDMHTHGGAGIDVNGATVGDFHRLGRFFASNGTTGWLCSILTDSREQTLAGIGRAVVAMKEETDGARLLGIHLEGPFLSNEYKGAMPEELLRDGSAELFREYQNAAGGAVRYLTVAPEVPGVPEMIRQIPDGTVVGIGHSGADYETACAAIDAGARTATHTFNAMGLFHQHRPGVMGAVLERDVYCEAICDGRHLHPGAVRMLLACKGYDRVIAITDSIQAAGLPDGEYKLGVNDIVVKDGDARLAGSDIRAGSTLTMGQALKNLVEFTGQPLERVLPLLSLNPARLLGIDDRKGSLARGKDADLVILDNGLNVTETYVEGKCVFAACEP